MKWPEDNEGVSYPARKIFVNEYLLAAEDEEVHEAEQA